MSNDIKTPSELVVGLGGSGHEWSSCIMTPNQVVGVAEERVCRKKYGLGVDLLAARSRRACLAHLGENSEAIQHAVACSLVPKPFYHALRHKTTIVNHHLAHAYSAFAASGYEEAAILIADNSGSILQGEKKGTTRTVETVSYYRASGDTLTLLEWVSGEHLLSAETESEFYQPGITTNSLGHFYREATLKLGFMFQTDSHLHPFSEDGKTMGLAAYGDDRFVDRFRELITFKHAGKFEIDPARVEETLSQCIGRGTFNERAAVAFAVQKALEAALLQCSRHLHAMTGLKNLCLAGGVMLNSVANGMLQQESPFENIYVTPAPSDDGISLGCAYYGLHQLCGVPLNALPRLPMSFIGPGHETAEVDKAMAAFNMSPLKTGDLLAFMAQKLAEGAVIAWFDGRSEFGPRALGHRTLFSAPFPDYMRDRLNFEIKKREWFRPYGPMVLAEKMDQWFDFSGVSPYMSFVATVKQPAKIPAATHYDGTARLQTLYRADNPTVYDLIAAFDGLTGVPILINTSFNAAGEPIVETPEDAIKSAIQLKVDYLYLQGRLLHLRQTAAMPSAYPMSKAG